MTAERYQIWETRPDRPDQLVGEFGGYAAAVRSITNVSRDRELHATPLSWSLRQVSNGKRLVERTNAAGRRQAPISPKPTDL